MKTKTQLKPYYYKINKTFTMKSQKYLFSFLLIVLFSTAAFAQSTFQSYPEINDTGNELTEVFEGILQTDDGGFITWGKINLGDANSAGITLPNYVDVLITKMDLAGNVQWSQEYPLGSTPEFENIVSFHLEITPTGYLGFTRVIEGNGFNDSQYFRGIKFDIKGQIEGSFEFSEYDIVPNNTFDYYSSTNIIDVLPTADGKFIVLGSNHGPFFNYDYQGIGYFDGSWLAKIDEEGVIEWSTVLREEFEGDFTFSSSSVALLNGLAIGPNNEIYISGSLHNYNRGIIIKHDENGNEIWHNVQAINTSIKSTKIEVDEDGFLYVLNRGSITTILDSTIGNGSIQLYLSNIRSEMTKLNENGDTLDGFVAEGGHYNFTPHDFCLLNDGNLAFMYGNGIQNIFGIENMKFLKMDPNFTLLYESSSISLNMSTDIEAGEKTRGSSMIPLANSNNWLFTGQQRSFSYNFGEQSNFSPVPVYGENLVPFLINITQGSEIPTANIYGDMFFDLNQNCVYDAGEEGILYQPITANHYTTFSGVNGSYNFNLAEEGDYAIQTAFNDYPYDLWSPTCVDSVNTYLNIEDTVNANFGYDVDEYCVRAEVDVLVPFLRQGFDDNFVIISYRNVGTLPIDSAVVTLTMSNTDIVLDSAFTDYTYDAINHTYSFSVGSLDVFEEGSIFAFAYIPLTVPLGATPCFTANITPGDECNYFTSDYDGSSLRVEATCLGDSIQFDIINEGLPMMVPRDYSIYADNLIQAEGDFILGSNEVMTVKRFANGQTHRLDAAADENAPYDQYPTAVIELCNTTNDPSSTGFINNTPTAGRLSSRDIECVEVTAAVDPNDKQVVPSGITDAHYINSDVYLEYKIRFQNTGTDTAFNIFVLDTLDSNLDLTTIEVGTASHDFTFSLLGNNVLRWDFPNIELPDSSVNEILSHGFLNFTIRLKQDMPQPYELHNSAAIYFDFQPPVITEDMFVTVCDECMIQVLPQVGHLLNASILLEGAYQTAGQMSTILQNLIPLEHPYDQAPYLHDGKEELLTIPTEMVDWVLVEARQGTPSLTGEKGTTTVETVAAILYSDGSIKGVNGENGVLFVTLIEDQEYYFCIRHRNHLDVLSATPLLASETMTYDFTTGAAMAFGAEQLKWLPNEGKAVMYSGDFNIDGTVQTTDYDQWVIDPAAVNVYAAPDANLDGIIQVSDFDNWFFNKAKLGSVEIGF